jgi:hypothetical protein
VSEILAFLSVIITSAALFATLWQNFLTRRSLQASVFITLEQLGEKFGFDEGIDAIYSLKNYNNYEDYFYSENPETKKLIYKTVKFLNYCAHLSYSGFIPKQKIWNLYFWGYRICEDKLLSWYLEGVRETYTLRFSNFERMCREIGSISEDSIKAWDKKLGIKNRIYPKISD